MVTTSKVVGLNVALDGRHAPSWIASTGANGIRIVLSEDHNLTDYLKECQDNGLSILGDYARESQWGNRSHGESMARYMRRYRGLIDFVEAGNEPDLESDSSWTMSQDEFETLGWQLHGAIRDASDDVQIIAGGLAFGQLAWLDNVDLSWSNMLGVHPYAKDMTTGNDILDANILVDEYRAATGLPVAITEWGWWSADQWRGESEVRDMVTWAVHDDRVAHYWHFCADDAMVWPFGLYDAQGNEKREAKGFRDAIGFAVDNPASPTDGFDIGSGLRAKLDELGWTPTSDEHVTDAHIVWAKAADGTDACVFWDSANGIAVPYRRSE